ncbi:hypothetical protein E1B28_002679 [Marasmius oreades]|uniref:HNH nuclease domain-containing protein n=1 Tax=Marasmius oreades TaxID=181124 RepID=A0A9P7UL23_9AGAR|nr:uncharacterized protein E1B28_002679 [Marasmius oreades]KAG7086747.1 hypothetical protein E1B28_002679 [Marasmius oreades]
MSHWVYFPTPPLPPAIYGNPVTKDDLVYVKLYFTILIGRRSVQVGNHDQPLLSIPKWQLHSFKLRDDNWIPFISFVCFAMTNSQGNLYRHQDPNQTPLTDADAPSLRSSQEVILHYECTTPSSFVDTEIDEPSTATESEHRSPTFRDEVQARDGCCPFTKASAFDSEAAHIVRHSKGDETPITIQTRQGTEVTILDSSVLHDDPEIRPDCDIYTLQYLRQNVFDPATPPYRLLPRAPVKKSPPNDAPPQFLFTAVYAAHCYHEWHTAGDDAGQLLKDWVKEYYPQGKVKRAAPPSISPPKIGADVNIFSGDLTLEEVHEAIDALDEDEARVAILCFISSLSKSQCSSAKVPSTDVQHDVLKWLDDVVP